MKKISFIAIIVGAMLAFGACADYLDVDHLLEDRMDLERVFASKDYSDRWLAGVYSHLHNENVDVGSKGHNPFNLISDDMYYGDRTKLSDGPRNYANFKSGNYDESWEQGSWFSCYEAIRDASTFIHNIDKNTEMPPSEVKDKKAQARFLRAYYYWLLLRKYGPIPLLPDEGLDFTADYADLAIPRSPYSDCVDFITNELALAAVDLPNVRVRTNREVAVPTRGAALAARAKVYLFGASPLFNGNDDAWAAQLVDHQGNRLVNPTPVNEKWAKAAAAAKEVIDLGVYKLYTAGKRDTDGGNMNRAPGAYVDMTFDYYLQPKTIEPPDDPRYSDKNFPEGWADIDPCESYRQLFNGMVQAYSNPELIFSRVQNQGGDNEDIHALALHQMPQSIGGWNAHGLSLKMYDAYYMKDGSDFDTDNRPEGYTATRGANVYTNYPPLPPNVSLQNANREPRFYASVAYNGSVWENESSPVTNGTRYKQVFYYRDAPGGDGKTASGFYLRTGIGIKKYYHYGDSNDGGIIIPSKSEPAIRFAEMYLIHAEALNELTGSYTIPTYDGTGTITVSRDPAAMSASVTPVRVRAGLPDYDGDVYADAAKFRTKIKREWQIEFMGEGHRYFDLRRWKDAPKEEQMPIKGFNMNMELTQRDLWHTPLVISSLPSIFAEKMYLWPISHGELRRNRNLTQNPGWTYFDE